MPPLEPSETLSRPHVIGEGDRYGPKGDGHPTARRAGPSPEPAPHAHRLVVLRSVWRARYRILLGGAIGAAFGLWFFRTHPVPYTSRAIALFNGHAPPMKDGPVMLGEVAPGPASLRLLATSSDILDNVIAQHGLYRHYRIDTSAAFFHEMAVDRLRHSVDVMVMEDGSISITVSDLDRTKAMELARAVHHELSEVVRERSEAYYTRQVALHNGLIADQEKRITDHLAAFEALAARLGPVLRAPDVAGTPLALDLQKDLAAATADLTRDYGELRSIGRNMEMLAAMHRDGLLGTLTLVERPMVDLSTNPRATMFGGIAACFLVALVMSTLLAGIWASEHMTIRGWITDLRKARQA